MVFLLCYTSWCKKKLIMKYFQDLDFHSIKNTTVFLDIDGTISHDNKISVFDGIFKKIKDLKEKNTIYLCSNSRNHKRNRKIAEILDLQYIDSDLRKPSKKILELIDNPKTKKLVIGDKFLTDGLFAKNIHAEFIKVKRIESKSDSFYIKFLYWIDDLVSKMIKL